MGSDMQVPGRIELWVVGSCCDRRVAWPEGGLLPRCGACGETVRPADAWQRRAEQRALVAIPLLERDAVMVVRSSGRA